MKKKTLFSVCLRDSDNHGVSLIELIVALLIISIITLPLLSIFTSAAKTNQVNAKNISADTVAQNIMEAIKVNGLDKIKDSFEKAPIVPNKVTILGLDVEKGVEDSTDASKDHIYEYDMYGIKEGDSIFNAHITLDATTEYKDVNTVASVDMSAFDNKTMMPVNLCALGYYDESALKEIYDAAVIRVDDYNSQQIDGKTEEEIAEYTPRGYMDLETLKNHTSRTINIRIDDYYDENGKWIDYVVKSNVVYKLAANYDGNGSSEYETLPMEEADAPHIDDLKTVYLYYVPYPFMSNSAFDSTYNNIEPGIIHTGLLKDQTSFLADQAPIRYVNQVNIINNSKLTSLDFFVVAQGTYGITFNTININATTSGAGSTVYVYSNAPVAVTGNGSCVQDNNVLKTKDPAMKDLILNVTVEVNSVDSLGNEDGQSSRTIKATLKE